MTKDMTFSALRTAALTALITLCATPGAALAQTPPANRAAAPANVLGLGEIESRLSAEGIKIKELKVRDTVLEIDGYDAQGREIDLVVDRSTGKIVSRKFDD